MIPPRPTMTAEDVRKLRDFFDSPAGRRMMGELNRAFDVPPMTIDQPEGFWRDKNGLRVEAEPPRQPEPVARVVSPWPAIIVAILSTIGFATLIAWYVSAALKGHA